MYCILPAPGVVHEQLRIPNQGQKPTKARIRTEQRRMDLDQKVVHILSAKTLILNSQHLVQLNFIYE